MGFVHLHNHTEYSLLDGAAKVNVLLQRAQDYGMSSIALTDHGVMYGVVRFYKKAKDLGIKPILGCEVYVAPRSRFDKESGRDSSAFHLVLLAENNEGYRNLCKLVSTAFLEGFYYKPRVDKELLRQHSAGIIALSACIAGEIPEAILSDDLEKAKELIIEYRDIFGKDNFFLEMQDHGMEEERKVNKSIAALAKELAVPLVVTNDIHYIDRDDADMHDILLCIQTGKLRSDENRMRFSSNEFYLKTEDEMKALFPAFPEAFENTVKIAERCNVELDLGNLYLPDFDVPEGFTLFGYLEHLCREGITKRYPVITEEIEARLAFELGVIEKTGFAGYFLIVWDIVKFSTENGVLVGPGRGSAAGSLVAYVLCITNVDPIRYNLLFERFLNPERVSPPDIDIDFCYENRGRVIEYLVAKYGEDKVCQIITFGTMKAKGAVKDVARVLNIPYSDAEKIAKMIPDDLGITIDDAMRSNPELREAYSVDPMVHELIDISRKIEGMPRHHSKHAAGVVISREALTNYMPVQKTGDLVVTQFEKEEVEYSGLLKMDLLGLRTLTVIGDALDNIYQTTGGERINIDTIPLDDEKTFDMLKAGDSIAVFQLESDGMRRIMQDLAPGRIEDIIALVALYRPGPLEGGMVDDFTKSKHGKRKIEYMHPLLEPILKETYGVILYQEQVMQIASALAGFTLGQSDMLRRAMGKKKPEIIAKERGHFVEGCVKNGVNKKTAGEIFDLMEKFAGYGFNKSHSAAYGIVAYQTAWLKANYPAEFMAAMLTAVMDKQDKVQFFIDECSRMNIGILPPDINESAWKFTVVGANIRFGLAAVKNVGREAVEGIIREREQNGNYSSMGDLCCRMQPNRKMLESLIKCGALDSMGGKRSQMMAVIEKALDLGKKSLQDKGSLQMSLFDFGMDMEQDLGATINFPDIEEYSAADLLNMEKEMIGFYVSGHPLDSYSALFKRKIKYSVSDLTVDNKDSWRNDSKIVTGGVVGSFRQLLTRKGEPMAFFNLEDKDASLRCVAFPGVFMKYRSLLYNGNVVLAGGKLKDDSGEVNLMPDEIAPPGKLYLRLPSQREEGLLAEVRALTALYPGAMPVSVYYMDMEQYIDSAVPQNVAPDKILEKKLKILLGEDSVVIK